MKPPIPIAVAASLALACVSLDASTPTHPLTANASLLAESLEVIQQTSAVILGALEPPLQDLTAPDELAEVAA